jgi:hypothetical protein
VPLKRRRRERRPITATDDIQAAIRLSVHPDFAHAVLGERADAVVEPANTRIRGEHFQNHIRGAEDPFVHDAGSPGRDIKKVRLKDQRTFHIKNDVDRRQDHLAATVGLGVVLQGAAQSEHDTLVTDKRRVGYLKHAVGEVLRQHSFGSALILMDGHTDDVAIVVDVSQRN